MSAYMCGEYHINSIVRYASVHKVTYFDGRDWKDVKGREQDVIEMLQAENAKSVNHRYSDDEPEAGYVYAKDGGKALGHIEVIKACHCLDYQSCEHDAWEASAAKKLLNSIESAAVRELPGYDEAAWEVRP